MNCDKQKILIAGLREFLPAGVTLYTASDLVSVQQKRFLRFLFYLKLVNL